MGGVVPLRPSPSRPKTGAEGAVWRVWQPVDEPFVFSFDRWRAAEIVRLAVSRNEPGLDWVEPFAAHLALLAESLDPAPDDGEVRRVVSRLVAGLIPIASEARERIEAGIGQFRWRSYELGCAVGLTPAERIALDIRSFRDVSQTPQVMAERRNARRRARDAERRRATGMEPQAVRRMRARMARRLAELADISDPTARKWLKTAESEGQIVMASVTSVEFERHVLGVLNKMQGRTNLKSVTPSAERKRRQRAKLKVEGAPQRAPGTTSVETDRPTLATLAAEALTLPEAAVSFDAARNVVTVCFRPVRPLPAGFDPASAVGNILRLDGWPVRSTAFDGATVEIGIGEAA